MSTINELNAATSLSAGDLMLVYVSNNGDTRKASMTVLKAFMQDNLTFSGGVSFTTQYASPSATAFNIQITDGSDSIHLILTPTAGFAAGTITMPAVGNLVDKQEILVNCTQAVTTLTIDGNGATVTGAPTTLAANDFFRLKYDLTTQVLYRVG